MKYSKKMIQECADWVKEYGLMEYGGATLRSFCEAMDIDDETYYNWMKKSEFSDAIKDAKDYFKSQLEKDIVKSLAMSAKGYEWEETVTDYKIDQAGKMRKVGKKTTNKHVSPNTGAAIFLLTNVNGERWKNKQNNDVHLDSEEWVGALKSITKAYEDEDGEAGIDK